MINPNATKYTKLHAKEPKIGNRMMFCDWHALLPGFVTENIFAQTYKISTN